MRMNGSLCDALDRLMAMRRTEASYAFQSFLQQQCGTTRLTPLSDVWRSKVTQWAFNVVDHFGLSREVVSVSMGIFDRYLATRGNVCSGNMVLLTSLTTLHLAIKLNETKRIKSSILANLSRGQFDTAHIEEMELKILTALTWKLSCPTPLAFISEFISFLPEEVSTAERKEVYELSKYMTELAVCESSFVDRQNSVVALASIRNVMESMKFAALSAEQREDYLCTLSEIMGQAYESQTMRETRERLGTMFAKVSATDAFETSYAAQSQYHQSSTGSRMVTPDGSPLSTASSSYDMLAGGSRTSAELKGCFNRKYQDSTTTTTATRTNFWYTPSPPTRSFGVKVGQVG